jgi:uroporphyrinogen III methyltransferase/synthase
LEPAGLDSRALAGLRIAVIGPGTATALARRGLRPDLVPERFVAESLLDAFPAPERPGARVLVARALAARDVLPDGLTELGYAVDVLPVYRTVAAEPDPVNLAAVRAGEFDAVSFTSSSTVTNFCAAVDPRPAPMPLVVSIGPVTSATAVEQGLTVGAEAGEHTIDGVIATLIEALAAPAAPGVSPGVDAGAAPEVGPGPGGSIVA